MIRLTQLRFDAGLSPEELGELAEVSGMTVRRIERGESTTAGTAKKIADKLEVSVTEMLAEVREAA